MIINKNDLNVQQLLTSTTILDILNEIVSMGNNAYWLKLEAIWILTNLVYRCQTTDELLYLLGDDSSSLKPSSHHFERKYCCSFISQLDVLLQWNLYEDVFDHKLFNQICWFFGNVLAMCQTDCPRLEVYLVEIFADTTWLECVERIFKKPTALSPDYLHKILWVLKYVEFVEKLPSTEF